MLEFKEGPLEKQQRLNSERRPPSRGKRTAPEFQAPFEDVVAGDPSSAVALANGSAGRGRTSTSCVPSHPFCSALMQELGAPLHAARRSGTSWKP